MMNYAALKTEIETDPAVVGYAAAGSDTDIADLLNAKVGTLVVSTVINARGLMARISPATAATILDKLEAAAAGNSVLKWANKFLLTDGLDVGHANTSAMLDQLVVEAVLTQAEADTVKALAVVPASRAEILFGAGVVVSPGQVSLALRGGNV